MNADHNRQIKIQLAAKASLDAAFKSLGEHPKWTDFVAAMACAYGVARVAAEADQATDADLDEAEEIGSELAQRHALMISQKEVRA